jgi:hypothetical protein
LGATYENLGNTLTESRCPAYLTDGECYFYKLGLEDAAYPQTVKAADVYFAGLQKAYELNLYNDNTALATRRLGELLPDQYPGLMETLPKPGYSSDKTKAFELEPTR